MINCVRELFARISFIRLLFDATMETKNNGCAQRTWDFMLVHVQSVMCDIVKSTRTANSFVCYSSLAGDDHAALFLRTQTRNDMSNAAKPSHSFGKCMSEIEIRTVATWARAGVAQRNNRKNSHCPYDPHALPSDCNCQHDQSERKPNVTQHAIEHGRTARFKTKENRSHRRASLCACEWSE